jgi:tetratricopeptide (TPR) repeat protein
MFRFEQNFRRGGQTLRGWLFPLVLILAAAWLAGGSALAQASFTASLDRNSISLGETVTLTLTIEGGSLQGQPSLASVPGLEYGGTSTSSQMMFDGSHMTSKTMVSFEVHPTHEGAFNIPAAQAVIDGKRMVAKPLQLKVVKGNLPDSPDKLEAAFVRLITPTNTIYAGQVVPVEIRCYCQAASGVQPPQLTADDFTVGNMPGFNGRAPQVTIRGTPYNFLSFRVPVCPAKTGTLTLGPATWSLSLVTRSDFFGNPISVNPVTVNSDTIEFHVLPIPANAAPDSFNGAVGQFSLEHYEAGPTTVAVGDPITLKIRLAGKGSFDNVMLSAEQLGWHEFKTYPPTTKLESNDPLQIEGAKYFEQVISPMNADVKEIPAFAFSYFDPDTHTFHTLAHAAIPLKVMPTAATPQPTVVSAAPSASDTPPPAQEIVNIKERPGALATLGPPWVFRPGFLAWQLAAPLAWVGALVWRRRKESLANNPRLRRRRDVARVVRQGLADLAGQARANDADAFYATVFRLLQEQLGERLDLPASAITEAVLEDARGRGLNEAGVELLRELFQACNQYRYTPEHTARELASLIPKVQTALEELQRMTPPSGGVAVNKLLPAVGCLLLLLVAGEARADTFADRFDQANRLYVEEQYAPAAAAYEKMIASGQVSPAVYFNMGNAWFKAGQVGKAIAAYRRAEELAPRDADVRANLQFARRQAGVGAPAAPGGIWTRWVARLTLNEWTGLAAVFVALFFLLLTLRQIRPDWKKSGAGWTTMLGVACVWWIACLGLALYARYGAESSVVVVPEAVVRRGPLPEAPSAFTAHDGAELLVLDRKDDWLQVADAARHVGWVPKDEVAVVP